LMAWCVCAWHELIHYKGITHVFDDDTLITGSFDGVVCVCLAWLRFITKA